MATALFAITACAGWEDYDPPVQREIPKGRGLLTGADGEFAVDLEIKPAAPTNEAKESSEPVEDEGTVGEDPEAP